MLLLRTIVLEHSGRDAPVNGALLCGFAVAQIASNFLAYSLDEETEPGSSRVYIATLRKKSERYFLGGIDSKDDLQIAMRVFKQILTLAASPGSKVPGVAEDHIPYHFVDLKGCNLPPARPEDHHSLTIKKSLVMKVITLGTSVPGSPAIESEALVVPSIRFSSRMVAPARVSGPQGSQSEPEVREPVTQAQIAPIPVAPPVERTAPAAVEAPMAALLETPQEVARQPAPNHSLPVVTPAKQEPPSLFEVDSTLTNLARVAQELTQQKRAVLEQEELIGLLRTQLNQEKTDFEQLNQRCVEKSIEKEASLQLLAQSLAAREGRLADTTQLQQEEQHRLSERAQYLMQQDVLLNGREQIVRGKEDQLSAMLSQVSSLRYRLGEALQSLDTTLTELGEADSGRNASQRLDLDTDPSTAG